VIVRLEKGKPCAAVPETSAASPAADLDAAADQAIAACGDDARQAVKALIVAGDFLKAQVAERRAVVSTDISGPSSVRSKGRPFFPSSPPMTALRPCFSANATVMRAEVLKRGCAGRTRADARPDSGSGRHASGPPGRRGLPAVLGGARRPLTTALARPPADQAYSDRRRKTVSESIVRDGRQLRPRIEKSQARSREGSGSSLEGRRDPALSATRRARLASTPASRRPPW
jgi:hypothetical protein